MRAAPDAQRRLLDLQAVDTTIAQLEHKRRTLPELAEITRAGQARQGLNEEIVAARTRVSDLEAEVRKAESDLVPVRDRQARDERRVNDGSVSDPKQLRALLEEIENLKRRTSDLEDVQLELMERLEASQAELDELSARRSAGDGDLRALLARRDDKLADLDEDLGERREERELIVADIPADLLGLYDKMAAKTGGAGAALLARGRCGGCQLQVTAVDLNRFRAAPDDEVLRCEECQRILVRTAESGL